MEVLMNYLDASPMISALSGSPDHFEFTYGSLHHIPSRHRFYFDPNGGVRVDAHCDCSSLVVHSRQERALNEAFNAWRVNYWSVLQINREFASHFDPPMGVRRLLIDLTVWMHHALLRGGHRKPSYQDFKVPAE